METEFAGCLLMVGPPNYIAVTMHSETNKLINYDYKERCREWYSLSLTGLGNHSSWLRWFDQYTYWLKDQGHGN